MIQIWIWINTMYGRPLETQDQPIHLHPGGRLLWSQVHLGTTIWTPPHHIIGMITRNHRLERYHICGNWTPVGLTKKSLDMSMKRNFKAALYKLQHKNTSHPKYDPYPWSPTNIRLIYPNPYKTGYFTSNGQMWIKITKRSMCNLIILHMIRRYHNNNVP